MSKSLSFALLLVMVPAGWVRAEVAIEPAQVEKDPWQPAAGDTSGWDWSGFTNIDDTPAAQEQAGPGDSAVIPPQPDAAVRVTETTEPDFEAEARSAMPLFAGAPDFQVIPSQRDKGMHPCGHCHTWTKSDPTPRSLKPPHDNFRLQHGLHGKGSFWCFTCHDLEGQGSLRTLEGKRLDYSEAYLLCSQCHSRQTRDWVFGAHGKRVGNWRGERQVYNCTVCHYQHRPALKPRAPLAGPEVRQGLARPAHWKAADERDDWPLPGRGDRRDGGVSGNEKPAP